MNKTNHVYWVSDLIRRKIEAGIPMLDDGPLAPLSLLEMLVKQTGRQCVFDFFSVETDELVQGEV